MDIRTPYIRTPYIGTPSIKAQSVGASLVTGATKDVIATPVIALTGNSVTITCDTTGATIYYTLDGSTPTSSSTQYSAAFILDSSCTIKAIAIKGGKSSGIAEEEYVKPITYLTQWKIVGNSEVHGNEIWSCGEYSAVDGKYHILVQPQGGSIADIALTEPLRKYNNNVADSIEFPSGIEGKSLVTRNLGSVDMGDYTYNKSPTSLSQVYRYISTEQVANLKNTLASVAINALCSRYSVVSANNTYVHQEGVSVANVSSTSLSIYLEEYKDGNYEDTIKNILQGVEIIYELATPTTELIDAPQIEEAESYTCEISQGGKAVSWSSFDTE